MLLKDRYGRTIEYLRLSVTDRCNLRCLYCMPDQGIESLGHDRIMSYEELLRVAGAAVRLGIRKIRVTGGEPLVRRGLVDFIGELARLPSAPEIVLTSNGLLLAEYADRLKSAGLARVNISLDTMQNERFVTLTRREGLDAVFKGLEAAHAAGLAPIKINMVPIRGFNDDEIGDFARMTLRKNCDVRFIEFMPVRSDLGFTADRRVNESEIMTALERVDRLIPAGRQAELAGPARMYRFPGGKGSLGVITAVSKHFCRECNRLRLTADGRLRPCLMSDDEIDLLSKMRTGGLDDRQLEAIMLSAADAKPSSHHLADGPAPLQRRTMKDIGG